MENKTENKPENKPENKIENINKMLLSLDNIKIKNANSENVFAITLQPKTQKHNILIQLSTKIMLDNKLNSKIDLYMFLVKHYFKTNKQ